jgi:hypothetical protein
MMITWFDRLGTTCLVFWVTICSYLWSDKNCLRWRWGLCVVVFRSGLGWTRAKGERGEEAQDDQRRVRIPCMHVRRAETYDVRRGELVLLPNLAVRFFQVSRAMQPLDRFFRDASANKFI